MYVHARVVATTIVYVFMLLSCVEVCSRRCPVDELVDDMVDKLTSHRYTEGAKPVYVEVSETVR